MLVELRSWLKPTFAALGGLGLLFSAFVDSSFVPLPLVTDLILMELSSRHPMRMPYYAAMAALVLIGVATTLFAHESEKSASAVAAQARETSLQRVVEAAVGAFSEFLTRDLAVVALVFVILFKFTDALSGAMTAPFGSAA